MIIHSYYYGPVGNGGLTLQTSQGLTSVIDEDKIRELYSKDGHPTRIIQFSNLYQTMSGPVIGVTRIEPSRARGRETVVNRTFFVRLEDVSNALFKLMDDPVRFPVSPLNAVLKVDGIT